MGRNSEGNSEGTKLVATVERHEAECDNMEILQSIFNHSDAEATRSYIGATNQKSRRL